MRAAIWGLYRQFKTMSWFLITISLKLFGMLYIILPLLFQEFSDIASDDADKSRPHH